MRIEEKYRKRKKAFHCILVYYHLCLALILACMRVPWLYFFLLLLLCIVDCGPVLCNTNVKYEFYAQHPFTCWIFTWITLNTNIPEWFQYSNNHERRLKMMQNTMPAFYKQVWFILCNLCIMHLLLQFYFHLYVDGRLGWLAKSRPKNPTTV